MPRPWRLRFAGARYHLTQRGNGGQGVFVGREDYERFLEQLDHALEKSQVVLFAYCLMPNHYHLMVETPMGNMHRFMQNLNTAYAMYFRYKHRRPGHCWQGRYGAKLVEGDAYLLRLTRYIHLNPVKTRGWKGRPASEVRAHLEGWRWSSYRGYVGLGAEESRIDYRWLQLTGRKTAKRQRAAYHEYLDGMLGVDDEEFLRESALSRYAIGDERCRERIADELRSKRMERVVTGDVSWPEDRLPSVPEIEAAVVRVFGVRQEDLHFHGQRAGVAKSVAVELCCRWSGESQREVGRYFGYKGDGGVSKQRHRLAARLQKDARLASRMEKAVRELSMSKVQV